MKLNTVNIIEYNDDTVLGIHSFSDDPEGNTQAEEHFSKILKEQEVSQEDIDFSLEEDYYEQGEYQLFITHG